MTSEWPTNRPDLMDGHLECRRDYAIPNETYSIMINELEWHGRFVNIAPNTTLFPLDLRP
jgi:hypothetical protein